MAQVIKNFEPVRKGNGVLAKLAAMLMDGKPRKLVQGEDFECTVASLYSSIRTAACQRGQICQTGAKTATSLEVRFVPFDGTETEAQRAMVRPEYKVAKTAKPKRAKTPKVAVEPQLESTSGVETAAA